MLVFKSRLPWQACLILCVQISDAFCTPYPSPSTVFIVCNVPKAGSVFNPSSVHHRAMSMSSLCSFSTPNKDLGSMSIFRQTPFTRMWAFHPIFWPHLPPRHCRVFFLRLASPELELRAPVIKNCFLGDEEYGADSARKG